MKNRVSHLFDPFKTFHMLQRELDRQVRGLNQRDGNLADAPLDIWKGENGAVINVELPGVELDQIDVSVEGTELRIHADRHLQGVSESETVRHHELTSGELQRAVQLPFEVDTEQIDASYRHGVLSISLVKSEKERPQKVTVKAG